MKQLYIDCGMGAAGDMLTAALLQLLPEAERASALDALNAAGIPGVTFEAVPCKTCGITGLSMHVKVNGTEEGENPGGTRQHEMHESMHHGSEEADHHNGHHDGHHHEHHSMEAVRAMISGLKLSDEVRADVLHVYEAIAAAESEVHGVPVSEIHFHEVGAMDAVADIAAVSYLLRRIGADQVIASPICVGSGTVRCAHGILPVPAPATAVLLKGIPYYSDERRGELCTPTGAALLRTFADSFGPMPAMRVESIGYGIGKKAFPWANCVRVMLGEDEDTPARGAVRAATRAPEGGADTDTGDAPDGFRTGDVWELTCNLDDMTGEEIGFAMQTLLDMGALDAWTVPIGMKRSRPGVLLGVLADDASRVKLEEAMIRLTTTLGVRAVRKSRRFLARRFETVETPEGTVRKKIAGSGGRVRFKYEYKDLAKIASRKGISLREAEYYTRGYDGD